MLRSKLGLLLLMSLTAYPLFATIFREQPLDEQIKNATAVIHGKYLGKSYKKLHDDQVVTEFTFSIIKSAGVDSSNVANKNNFKILSPGGVWQGIVYQVHGAPSFQEDEEVVVLINGENGEYFFSNLALSKYQVIKEKGKVFLKSSVFPYHPNLGEIPYDEFNQLVYNKFGYFVRDIRNYQERNIASINNLKQGRKGRSPASEFEDEKAYPSDEGRIHILWLVFLLGIIGAYPTYSFKKKKK